MNGDPCITPTGAATKALQQYAKKNGFVCETRTLMNNVAFIHAKRSGTRVDVRYSALPMISTLPNETYLYYDVVLGKIIAE